MGVVSAEAADQMITDQVGNMFRWEIPAFPKGKGRSDNLWSAASLSWAVVLDLHLGLHLAEPSQRRRLLLLTAVHTLDAGGQTAAAALKTMGPELLFSSSCTITLKTRHTLIPAWNRQGSWICRSAVWRQWRFRGHQRRFAVCRLTGSVS